MYESIYLYVHIYMVKIAQNDTNIDCSVVWHKIELEYNW